MGQSDRSLAALGSPGQVSDAQAPDATGSASALDAEHQQLLAAWSGQGRVFPNGPSLAHRFEAQADATPDRVALTCGTVHLTYRELNARANQLAHFLRALGVGPESFVGLYMERGIDLIVGLLGIVKSGGAYLPMDLAYPPERLAFMAADAQAHIVLSSASAGAAVSLPGVRLVALDAEWPAISEHSAANPYAVADPSSVAYAIYTSGSTGTPKGCTVTNANAIRLFEATRDDYAFAADDVWTLFHSHAFDFSVWEIWGPLLHGGRLVVVTQEESRVPAQFLDLLVRERVTFLNQTPSAFKQLTAAVVARSEPAPLALRYVVLGGEPLELEALRPWFDRHGDEAPRLVNGYGPTEATVFTTFHRIRAKHLDDPSPAPIGRPLADVRCYVLDAERRLVPIGTAGELFIGGAGVTQGYLRREELTRAKFVEWAPDAASPASRLYASGDLVRWSPTGVLEYLGRIDQQVKLRGFRIELGEIESALSRVPGVASCAVVARRDRGPEPRLVAYMVESGEALRHSALRDLLHQTLPDYMVPSSFVTVAALPMTTNGKLDQQALPDPDRSRPDLTVDYAEPVGALEQRCCETFAGLLQLDRVGRHDNFFELGGDSLLAVRAAETLERLLARRVTAGSVFSYATPAALAASLAVASHTAAHAPSRVALPLDTSSNGDGTRHAEHTIGELRSENAGTRNAKPEPIALIALAARLPGADTTEEFWANLLAERDSVTFFAAHELDASIPDALRADSAYVPARTVLRDPEGFDPAFFGLSQREGELMDPQQRLLLELSWEALERAGYAPDRTAQDGHTVGVFAGVYSAEYLRKHVYAHPDLVDRVGSFAAMLATDKDYVTTRIAHRLNLTGPAVSVHTACSTALVAIVQALDSLRAGRCTMAIAGGASLSYPPRSGYLYEEGAMLSKDGLTRTFDAAATGTVFGDGGAVVLMKRLSDAIADGDQVYAVLRGAGLNNDGGNKASFTAPSVDGQTRVIAAAHRDADIEARTISYVEAHGTATPLGDPVEIEALTRAFREGEHGTPDQEFCRVGSAKSNVGHVVAAAGAVGVIKTALSLAHEVIPATLHFQAPNPRIQFAGSPFVVNAQTTAWPRGAHPRRAGVSAFGVGGTNAHVVLEEAPPIAPSTRVEGPHVFRLSARSPRALERAAALLEARLVEDPGLNLADVAHTLRTGRSEFSQRLVVVASDAAAAAAALAEPGHALRASRKYDARARAIIFVFPGQGAQYPGMGAELYESEPVFRAACDEVFAALAGVTSFDLKDMMFAGDADVLMATAVTQPATFCLEYALAALWASRGIVPAAMIGHSVGEFVAAVLSGVMSLADSARLVARRGAMMNALPEGHMLSVRASADALRDRLPQRLSIAAENGPSATVIAGTQEDVATFAAELEREGTPARRLQASHAFHSWMMDPVLDAFDAAVREVPLAAPRIPIISSRTGRILRDAEATDPSYWVRHLRETVRFSSAVQTALEGARALFLEVGPRHSLSTLVRQHRAPWPDEPVPPTVATLADGPFSERDAFALAVGQLWMFGVDADRAPETDRRRVRLPTYPFERVRCWLDAAPAASSAVRAAPAVPVPVSISDSERLRMSQPVVVAPPLPPDRRTPLLAKLRTMFEDIGGIDLAGADPSMSFVELGLDSLVLTQAAIKLKRTFAVRISFRQLMEQYRSLDGVAAFLEGELPAESLPAAETAAPTNASATESGAVATSPEAWTGVPVPVASGPVASVTGAEQWSANVPPMGASAASFAQQVIQQQLAIMQQQLALLGGSTAAGGPMDTAVASPTPPVSAPPAPQLAASVPATVEQPSVADSNGAGDDAALAHTRYDVTKAFGAIARIHTRPTSELSERQARRLEAFVRRYVARTQASKSYTQAHRPHLADPRVVNGFRRPTKEICYQVVVKKSKGSRMWDLDDNEYVDVLSGFGMSLFGWQPDFVNEAVKQQIDDGHDIGPQHPLAGEVAELVCELTGFDRAGLCNTGSEAVMGAIRIARTVTGRDLVVMFSGSYHGIFDEVLVRGTRRGSAVPAAPGILQNAVENILVLDYGTPESLEIIRSRAEEIAAVLTEPVQSRRPEHQPIAYLKELRRITAEHGVVLIFDEVITGFRAHPRGVQGLFGVTADLATYGKVVGGGYPIGIIAGKREFMDALDGGTWQFGDDSIPTVGVTYFAGTFVRHPLALAACRAVLLHLKEQGPALQDALTVRTSAMAEEMNAAARAVGAPLEIRHFASLWRIAFTEEHPLQDVLWAMMRNRGIHILDNFPCFLTTAHSDDDIARVIAAFKEALTEMIASEFLPGHVEVTTSTADATDPPVPHARLGRDRDGSPAWFVPDPDAPGQYLKLLG